MMRTGQVPRGDLMEDEDEMIALMWRVRGEFLEMPGLRLTESQAQRLWGLDATECRAVLAVLVTEGFLVVRNGAYKRNGL